MKRNFLNVLGVFIYTIAVVAPFLHSCNKDMTDNASLDDYFRLSATAPQQFTINAGQNQTITGSSGTRIQFPAGSLTDAGGNPVSGTVQVFLTEVYDKADMLRNGRPTMAGQDLLVSGGVINLSAWQNGQRLSLGQPAIVSMPGQTVSPVGNMEVFYWGAGANGTDSTWIPQDSTWNPQDTSGVAVGQDSIPGSGWFYYFPITELTWINCDYFWQNTDPRGDVLADAPSGYDISNTAVFIVLSGYNSIVQVYGGNCGGYEFCSLSELPQGLGFSVAALHYDASGGYSSCIVTGLTTSMSVTVNLQNFAATTTAQFNTDINAL